MADENPKKRRMFENTKNITNLNRDTGKFETVLGGRYWHKEYSDREIAPGIKHGKLIVMKIDMANTKFYCWTEGLEKLKKEPIFSAPDKPDGCHNLGVFDTCWLAKPVAEWVVLHDRWV